MIRGRVLQRKRVGIARGDFHYGPVLATAAGRLVKSED
jgi:hypothetical protein